MTPTQAAIIDFLRTNLASDPSKLAILDDVAEYVRTGSVEATDGLALRVLGFLAWPFMVHPGWDRLWSPDVSRWVTP